MKKLLTVVVPAYNAEKYIKTNLDTLCREEFLDALEVLVVDDGSSDRTGKIADSYEERFPGTVRTVHKENGGHGSGINCGIHLASGIYFKVVDADDWVDTEAFKKLLSFLENTDVDAVVSGFYWVYDNGSGDKNKNLFPRKAEIKEPFSGVQYGRVYQFDEIADKIYVKMHGLTIRTKLLREYQIKIDEKCFYVDTEYILYPVPYITTISFIENFVYQYRIGRSGQSISPARMVIYQAHYERVLKSLLCFFETCRDGTVVCSAEKITYIAGVIARVAAGKIKIILSLPVGPEKKKELMDFDGFLKTRYPEIYFANCSRPVALLRKSRYILYPAAAHLLQIKNRRG